MAVSNYTSEDKKGYEKQIYAERTNALGTTSGPSTVNPDNRGETHKHGKAIWNECQLVCVYYELPHFISDFWQRIVRQYGEKSIRVRGIPWESTSNTSRS